MSADKRRRQRAGLAVAAALALLAGIWFAGPRVAVETTIRFDPALIGVDAAAYLQEREARVPGIRDGLAKEIVWADPQTRQRTPLALVYVHGFSASRGESRPVPGDVAERLGANLFFTRLTGHGRDGAAMAEATVNDWLNDVAEAVAIGERIGEKVVVMATSTGAGLATVAAAHPEFEGRIEGLVLISPNYRLQARGAFLLTAPWGGMLANRLLDPERGFAPRNEAHARYWTTRYPTSALLPMAAATKLARQTNVEKIDVPALFIYSPHDRVVDPAATASIAARWGAPAATVTIESSGDFDNHVIAGDALSPVNNSLVTELAINWIGQQVTP